MLSAVSFNRLRSNNVADHMSQSQQDYIELASLFTGSVALN